MKATIKAISKYQGIKFDNQGDWFNPKTKEHKEFIKILKVGDEIEYSADVNKKFIGIGKIRQETITPKVESKVNKITNLDELHSALSNPNNELSFFLNLAKSETEIYTIQHNIDLIIQVKKTMALEKIARIMDKK